MGTSILPRGRSHESLSGVSCNIGQALAIAGLVGVAAGNMSVSGFARGGVAAAAFVLAGLALEKEVDND